MDKKDEALKLALEALEVLGWQPTEEAMDYRDNAIDAIHKALASQPAQQEPVAWGVFDGPNLHDVNFTEEDAQEMVRLKGDGSVVKPLYTDTQPQMQPCAGRNCGSTNPNLHSVECFEDYEKATGMRAWQGLTDEEKAELDAEHGDDTLAHLDAIEAKLREKNA